MAIATYVTLRMQDTINNLDILSAIRFAIVAPERGDAPHSTLVTVLATAGWTQYQTTEVCAELADLADVCRLPDFWPALAQEVAAAAGIDAPPNRPSIPATAQSHPYLDARRPPDHHGREHQRAGDHHAPPRPRAEASVRLRTLGGPR